MSRTVSISVLVPARGEKPGKHPCSWNPDPTREYREAERVQIDVLNVPEEIDPQAVQDAVQMVFNATGSLYPPLKFATLEAALIKLGYEFFSPATPARRGIPAVAKK